MIRKSTRGFTLIELLVVITIIGILATGGFSVYTGAMQKARDSTRLGDVEKLNNAIQSFNTDKSQFPPATSDFTGIITYSPKIPVDVKSGQPCSAGSAGSGGTACDYIYTVGQDSNGVNDQSFKLSAGFEDKGNVDSRAVGAKDGGIDDKRYEVGTELQGNSYTKNDTKCDRTTPVTITPPYPQLSTTICPQGMTTNNQTTNPVVIITGN